MDCRVEPGNDNFFEMTARQKTEGRRFRRPSPPSAAEFEGTI
jgi:hypothetical protein